MIVIFFFIFAFLTVFLSIRLSVLSDYLSNNSKISKAFIGGILLAGITALPEFVTCLSSLLVDNPSLALGDVLGSNMFNIFMICFFDFIYIKKRFFGEIGSNHVNVYLFLIINYCFILFNMLFGNFLSLGIIGFPSLVIFITYICYVLFLSNDNEEVESEKVCKSRHLGLRLVLVAVFLVFFSTLLTITVDKISVLYPNFSGSILGAILLGITTSLPEVITFFTLFKMKSYNMALANIIGSNLFNLLVLAIGDLILVGANIYTYFDFTTIILVVICILFSVINLIQIKKGKKINVFGYGFLSFLVILVYMLFWFIHFVH